MPPNKRILLIEDNGDDVALMERALRKSGLGIDLQVADDGEVALKVLEAQDVPDLIILDLQLPKVSGHEVLRRIRKLSQSRYVPVIILTSSVLESDLARAYDNGANSYMQKPLELKEFERAVKLLAHYWCDINRVPPAGHGHGKGGLRGIVEDGPLRRLLG